MTTQEWRKRLKAAHICLDCGQQDAYTLNGYTYCHDCNEKRNRRAAEYRRANREVIRAKDIERRERYIANGRCAVCGTQKKTYEVGTECGRCAAKKRVRMNKAYAMMKVVGT